MRTQLGSWARWALLLTCVSGISSHGKTLKDVEKAAAEAKSLQELLSTPLLREHYSQALKSYLQRDRFRCESFEKIVAEVEKQINDVPELASQLWDKRSQEEYSFLAMQKMVMSPKAPARRVPYRLVSAARPFHALFADPATTGCLSDKCDHSRRMGAERWVVALKKSRVYFVEREGMYNDLALHIVPLKKDDKTYGLVYTTGGPAWNRPWEIWNPVTKKPYETTLVKFALAQIRTANPDVWDGFLEKETPTPQVAKKKKIFSDKPKSEIVQNEAFRFVPEDSLVIRMQAHFPRFCATESSKLNLMQFATADDNAKFIAIVPDTGLVLPFATGTSQASTTSTTTTNPLSTLSGTTLPPTGTNQKITLEMGNQKSADTTSPNFSNRGSGIGSSPLPNVPSTTTNSASAPSSSPSERSIASTSPASSGGNISIIHEGDNIASFRGAVPPVIARNFPDPLAESPDDRTDGGATQRPRRTPAERLEQAIERQRNPAALAQEVLERSQWPRELTPEQAARMFEQRFEDDCKAKKTSYRWLDWGTRLWGIPEATAEEHGGGSKELREIDDCGSSIPSSLKPKKVYRGHFVWNENQKIYERDLTGKAECVTVLTDTKGVPTHTLRPFSVVGPEMLDLAIDPKVKAYIYFGSNKFSPYCNSEVDDLKVKLAAGGLELEISLQNYRKGKLPETVLAKDGSATTEGKAKGLPKEPEPELNDIPGSCGDLAKQELKDHTGFEKGKGGEWVRYREPCKMCDGPPTCISYYHPPEHLSSAERKAACQDKEVVAACSICNDDKSTVLQCAELKERLKKGTL